MLDSTLVIVMSEFGRTPTINRNYGRDHWSRAWSVALAGCGIKGGAVVGKTNANGTAVTDRQVHGGHLFHTYLRGRPGLEEELLHRSAADPDGRSQGFCHRGDPGVIKPEKIHAPTPVGAASRAAPDDSLRESPGPARLAGPTVDPAQTRLVQELKHTSPLIGCRFDPSGEFLFAGSQDNSVQRWQLSSGKKTALLGHKSWIRAFAGVPPLGGLETAKPPKGGTPTGTPKLVFSASWDGKILAWPLDAETPTPRITLDAHKGWVRALAVSPDGKVLASCGNDHLVKLWSIPDLRLVQTFAGHDSHVYNVAFHPKGGSLVSADLKGIVKVWNLQRNKEERVLEAKLLNKYDTVFGAEIGGVRSIAFNAEGSLLACAGITDVTNAFAGVGKPVVVLFDWQSGKIKHLLRPRQAFQGTAWGVAFHPAGYVVGVGGGSGGALWYWKPDGPADIFTLKLPNNARDVDLHPDGKRLAIPFFDGAVRIYDLSKKA